MDGFVAEAEAGAKACKAFDQECAATDPDAVMGYHDAQEIPNYWAYAKRFVLQDHMLEPSASWSLPAHLFMVSAWLAACDRRGDPTSCHNALARHPASIRTRRSPNLDPTTPGPTSPGCCTTPASAGRTMWSTAPGRTAPTTR
jgi:phospholipase C